MSNPIELTHEEAIDLITPHIKNIDFLNFLKTNNAYYRAYDKDDNTVTFDEITVNNMQLLVVFNIKTGIVTMTDSMQTVNAASLDDSYDMYDELYELQMKLLTFMHSYPGVVPVLRGEGNADYEWLDIKIDTDTFNYTGFMDIIREWGTYNTYMQYAFDTILNNTPITTQSPKRPEFKRTIQNAPVALSHREIILKLERSTYHKPLIDYIREQDYVRGVYDPESDVLTLALVNFNHLEFTIVCPLQTSVAHFTTRVATPTSTKATLKSDIYDMFEDGYTKFKQYLHVYGASFTESAPEPDDEFVYGHLNINPQTFNFRKLTVVLEACADYDAWSDLLIDPKHRHMMKQPVFAMMNDRLFYDGKDVAPETIHPEPPQNVIRIVGQSHQAEFINTIIDDVVSSLKDYIPAHYDIEKLRASIKNRHLL